MMTRKKVLRLATATLVFMSLTGVVIMELFHDRKILEVLVGHYSWYYQLILGGLYGALTALAGWQLVKLPQLKDTNDFFTRLIGGLNLSNFQILYISICAGVGEEILFRGALQPFMGIWITSILFVFLHGYLNPNNLPLTFYGVYMVLVIAGIGYLAEYNGLLTSITAHFVIDWILITKLRNSFQDEPEDYS